MKKAIDQIKRVSVYGNECNLEAEPSREDVLDAVQSGKLETRNFQLDQNELAWEWRQRHPEGCVSLARQYHAQRIAFFWVKDWPEEYPIEICAHDVLEDGGHRLLAVKYMGEEETVDCVIVACNKCGRV